MSSEIKPTETANAGSVRSTSAWCSRHHVGDGWTGEDTRTTKGRHAHVRGEPAGQKQTEGAVQQEISCSMSVKERLMSCRRALK